MVVERVVAERRDVVEQLRAQRRRDAARDADVVQRAVVVVEAEQQRADALAVFVDAVPGDHAVGRAFVLHLHHRALAGPVRAVERLGDDAVEPRAFEVLEPVGRDVAVARGRA